VDLYRVLRVSIYLTVASGAFALSVAEHNLTYLFAVLLFGGLAYVTVDSGRVKPVRMEYAAAMTLALLLYTLIPLREDDAWNKHFPAAAAHFLCAFQVLLFFTSYRGSVLLTFCGATLLVVVVSGVIQPDVSLVVRMACYVGLTAWTLFIHALWRSREDYNHSSAVALGASPPEAARNLSERAFWQGLNMTLGLSAACLLLGALFFFLAPRVNERVMAIVDNWIVKRAPAPTPPGEEKGPGLGTSREWPQGTPVKGWSEGVDYRVSGEIKDDHRVAYSVFVTAPAAEFADRKGRVYLRGMAMSEHVKSGRWTQDRPPVTEPIIKARQVVDEAARIGVVELADPSTAQAATEKRRVVNQVVEQKSAVANVFFSLGPIARVKATDLKGVMQNRDGTVWKIDSQIARYEVASYAPVFAERLEEDAIAEHPDYGRYVRDCGLSPEDTEAIRKLAQGIVMKAGAETSLQKIRAILAHLRNPANFEYTLKGENLTLHEFLLQQGKGRGQCGYFATAFALMCRLNKIPARIASGFCLTLSEEQRDKEKKEQLIEFRNSDSHAWAEVHFKGIGWVTFDATPEGESENPTEIASTAVPPKAADDAPAPPAPPPQPQQGFLSRAWDQLLGYNSRDQRNVYDRIASTVGNGLGGARDVFTGRAIGGWLMAAIAWLAVGTLLYFLLAIFLKRGPRRIGSLSTSAGRARAAVAFYNDLLQVLSRRGFTRKPGQTPREFAEFVLRRGGDAFQPVLVVTNVFEQVRYGGVDVSQDDFNALQTALDKLRELTFAAPAPKAGN